MTDTFSAPPLPADTQAQLAGQVLVCNLLGKLFYEPPETAWLELLANEAVFDEIPFGAQQPEVAAGLGLLQQWAQAYRAGQAEARLDALHADYTRLFVGPGQVTVPPWESAQVDDERLLFQDETLQVRGWYRRFGLQAERLHQEPDDHVGLELVFLAHLGQLALAAAAEGDRARLTELLAAERMFLQAHAQRWIPSFCAQVGEHAQTGFYRGVALVTAGVLAALGAALAETVVLEVG